VDDAEFKDILLNAVDYGLLVLGEIVRKAIYERLESSYQVKRAEIPENLESFHVALAGLFGRRGSVVERLIARRLYSKLRLTFEEHQNWTLVDYVNHAKNAVRVG
jgi:predicted amino acid racemase